jgi:transcriptional regulator with XRE-family HTH domain
MTKTEILQKISEEMKRQGVTQNSLSKMTGLKQPFISKLLKEGKFSFDTLENILNALNMDIAVYLKIEPFDVL